MEVVCVEAVSTAGPYPMARPPPFAFRNNWPSPRPRRKPFERRRSQDEGQPRDECQRTPCADYAEVQGYMEICVLS